MQLPFYGLYNGCHSILEMVECLRKHAQELEGLAASGWELQVNGDNGEVNVEGGMVVIELPTHPKDPPAAVAVGDDDEQHGGVELPNGYGEPKEVEEEEEERLSFDVSSQPEDLGSPSRDTSPEPVESLANDLGTSKDAEVEVLREGSEPAAVSKEQDEEQGNGRERESKEREKGHDRRERDRGQDKRDGERDRDRDREREREGEKRFGPSKGSRSHSNGRGEPLAPESRDRDRAASAGRERERERGERSSRADHAHRASLRGEESSEAQRGQHDRPRITVTDRRSQQPAPLPPSARSTSLTSLEPSLRAPSSLPRGGGILSTLLPPPPPLATLRRSQGHVPAAAAAAGGGLASGGHTDTALHRQLYIKGLNVQLPEQEVALQLRSLAQRHGVVVRLKMNIDRYLFQGGSL